MIRIEHVDKSYDGHKVIDDVSIFIKQGNIYGLIGENGAGKSTLLQCVAGVYKQDAGKIEIDDQIVYENNEIKEEIAYVADRNLFFKNYTVIQLVNLFEMIYPSFSRERFDTYNNLLGLNLKAKVKNLSKGMQTRLSVMLNMARKPKVLLLDEPTSGLDPVAKKQVLDAIIELVDEIGTTVLISSHHLADLERICDEVTMLSKGKVVYQSTVENVKNKVKKLQIVFNKEVPSDLKNWQGVISMSHIGSVYYMITNAYSGELVERLKKAGAITIDVLGLDLEEIFVYTELATKQENIYLGGDKGEEAKTTC